MSPVPPIVRVHQTKLTNYGERSMLECSVVGFFPQEVRVSWLRDGVEVSTDVSSTDVLPNEDWSFQLHSYLELTPKRGERVSCRVDHSTPSWKHIILRCPQYDMNAAS
uniref:Ig-like domain-containing protein n=1 Tax=Seriola lalandi dorsalis TaxID=1841481 RepID=A0A3B4WXU5_SERLL